MAEGNVSGVQVEVASHSQGLVFFEGGEEADKWMRDVNQGVIQPSAEEIDHLRRLYDGNLAFADQEVGILRAEMESRGLLDNTLVIVTGDHGEALFEHGFIGHNTHIFTNNHATISHAF